MIPRASRFGGSFAETAKDLEQILFNPGHIQQP